MNLLIPSHNEFFELTLEDVKSVKEQLGLSFLTLSEYATLTSDTAKKDFGSLYEESSCWLICLVGEVGEVANLWKKAVWHGHTFNKTKFEDEMGDILWYFTRLALAWGIDLDGMMTKNIEKVGKRYPKGFDPERSINRVDNATNPS